MKKFSLSKIVRPPVSGSIITWPAQSPRVLPTVNKIGSVAVQEMALRDDFWFDPIVGAPVFANPRM